MKKLLGIISALILAVMAVSLLTLSVFAGWGDGWHQDERGWFHITKGKLDTFSIVPDSGGDCYVGSNGYMVYDCRINIPDETDYHIGYVMKDGHVAYNRWVNTTEGWRYCTGDGSFARGCWMKDSAGWCYLESDGNLAVSKRIPDTNGLCFVDENGRWVTKPGWRKLVYEECGITVTEWMYVKADGYLARECWMKDSAGWCYLDDYGVLVTSDTVKDTKGWCLVDENGRWVTKPGWQALTWDYGDEVLKDWFYVEKNGYLKTNSWMQDAAGWCYLDESGWMTYDGVVRDKAGVCYLNSDGYWETHPGIYVMWVYVPETDEFNVSRVLVQKDGYVKVSTKERISFADLDTYNRTSHTITMLQCTTTDMGYFGNVFTQTVKTGVKESDYLKYCELYTVYDPQGILGELEDET